MTAVRFAMFAERATELVGRMYQIQNEDLAGLPAKALSEGGKRKMMAAKVIAAYDPVLHPEGD